MDVDVEIANNLKPTNMSKCPNCGSVLTCGCQKRKLANGSVGCSKCVTSAPNNKQVKAQIVNPSMLGKNTNTE